MSAKAFVMVKVEPAATRKVVEQLKKLSGAVVYEVLGPYDIVLDIEADTQEDLTAVLRNSVRTQVGVTDTVTCICFQSTAHGTICINYGFIIPNLASRDTWPRASQPADLRLRVG